MSNAEKSSPLLTTKLNYGMFTSRTEEWETPQYVFDVLNKEFDFQVDVCATFENSKCRLLFDKSVNGLKQKWSPLRCWMNPPYGKEIYKWMKKAYEEAQSGAVVVSLVPARTDTGWWHDWVMKSAYVRFIRGRLQFGDSKQSAPFPSCIVIFKRTLRKPRFSTITFDKK
jgi:site-specific DNA-methyltransferase (adenine-specific)